MRPLPKRAYAGVRGLTWNALYGAIGQTAVAWFLAGNALYHTKGISLTIAQRDNRAFCTYVGPSVLPLKLTSRFSLLKIAGERARCNKGQACVKVWPMNIRILEDIKQGERIRSMECILCQTCISACVQEALRLSFALDVGGKKLLLEQGGQRHEQS